LVLLFAAIFVVVVEADAVADEVILAAVDVDLVEAGVELGEVVEGLFDLLGAEVGVEFLGLLGEAVFENNVAFAVSMGVVVEVVGIGCPAVEVLVAVLFKAGEQFLFDVVFADGGWHGALLGRLAVV